MIEKVGNVSLNYQYYKGNDEYSDGSIEDDILELVSGEKNVLKIMKEDFRWPVLYHLSPVRQNILEWYDMDPNAEILEVGSGCGAITGVLCRKAKKVTCIELSKKRSLINANRNSEYDNLEIMVGNFNDIPNDKKYDLVTLIGVLEYANYYTDAENPFVVFLERIKSRLKPGGKVIIAIENKYGLKYWAGAREDHTGVFFDGIEGYHTTDSKVATFSKPELESMLHDAGYKKQEFFYPFPDYKFPEKVFSDAYLPKSEDLACGTESYDNSRMHLFNETLAFGEIVKAGQFPFFSNSYLIVAE